MPMYECFVTTMYRACHQDPNNQINLKHSLNCQTLACGATACRGCQLLQLLEVHPEKADGGLVQGRLGWREHRRRYGPQGVETSRPCSKGVGWWKSWGLERWKLSNRETSREADGLLGEHHCSNHKA